jgi:hypothetical protein
MCVFQAKDTHPATVRNRLESKSVSIARERDIWDFGFCVAGRLVLQLGGSWFVTADSRRKNGCGKTTTVLKVCIELFPP